MNKTTKLYQNRVICMAITVELYQMIIENPLEFRQVVDDRQNRSPHQFPSEMSEAGYRMKDCYWSKRQGLLIRRITIRGVAYTLRPSFLTPYLTARVEEVEKAMFLRKFHVPFWALEYVFQKPRMFFYRLENHLGRFSVVGTTVYESRFLPQHLLADEKHTRHLGKKAFVAFTVAKECVLGVALSEKADQESLKIAYGTFQQEAQDVDPTYAPSTVNCDGWEATQNAWKFLFPSIVIIRCLLHGFISIRDAFPKKAHATFQQFREAFWNAFHAPSKASFSQRLRRLSEWTQKKMKWNDQIQQKVEKLRKRCAEYQKTYEFPEAHKTSNMLDRVMRRLDRRLFSAQNLHGSKLEAERNLRAWALIHNFAPSFPAVIHKYPGFQSPVERLNQGRYHENWLQNLYLSASLAGYRSPPQKAG